MKVKQSDGKTGTREWSALIAILIGIFSTDMTPTILFKAGKTSTWMFPLIWVGTIIFPLLALLWLLKAYKDKGLIQIIYHLTGKYIGFIINIFIFILLLAAMVLNSRSYMDILRGLFLPNTPLLPLFLVIIGTSFFIAKRGFETIGRVSYIIIGPIIIVNILLVILLFDNLTFTNIFPLWGPGVKTIVKEGVTQTSIIAEIILISIFYKYSRNHKDYKIGTFVGLGIGIVQFVILLLVYTMVFGSSILEAIPYPYHQLTKIAGIERFFTNFSSIYLFFWLQISIIRFAIYLYLLAASFSYTFKVKEFEPLILPFAVLTVILGLLPKNPVQATIGLRSNVLLEQSWIFFFYLPIVLWWIAYFKGDLKKQ